MVEEILVERKIADGEKFIRQLQSQGFDVSVASWILEDDSGMWYFYIASPTVDEFGTHEGYGIIGQELRKSPDLAIESYEIKLIGAANPAAKEMFALRGAKAAQFYVRHRIHLGGLHGGDAYIYPQITPD